jgi:hypothetical protein
VVAALAAAAATVIPGIGRAGPATSAEAFQADSLSASVERAGMALALNMERADRATVGRFACDCAARVVPLYELFGPHGEAFRRALRGEDVVVPSARVALGKAAFTVVEHRIARFEKEVARGLPAAQVDALHTGPASLRMLVASMAAARAMDQALWVARLDSVCEPDSVLAAIAEAVYLKSIFQNGDASDAADAVFDELAWQRAHLRLLLADQ